MRLGWHVHLFGPIGVGGTLWRSKRRRAAPKYKVMSCGHAHRTQQAYQECLNAGIRHDVNNLRATLRSMTMDELGALIDRETTKAHPSVNGLQLISEEIDRRIKEAS